MEKNEAAAGERVYEDFDPLTQWAPEAQFDTLIVYLPGFKREQLKVQITSSHLLRIMGERPVGIGDIKWIRFRKEFPIPSNYDANNIAARFDGGSLYIRHPKITIPSNSKSSDDNQIDPHQKPKPAGSDDLHDPQTKTQNAQKQASKTTMAMDDKPTKDNNQKVTDSESTKSNGQEQRKEKSTTQQFKTKDDQEQTSKTAMMAMDDHDQKPGKNDHDHDQKEKSRATDKVSDKNNNENQKAKSKLEEEKSKVDSAASDHVPETSMEKSSDVNGTSKSKMKDATTRFLFTNDWGREMNNGRALMNLILVVLLIVVVGIYARNAFFKSIPESENN